MSTLTGQPVLIDTLGARAGSRPYLKQAALVALGVLAIALAAQIHVPMWPVPATMQTFAVLTVGAAFGARLGLVTLLAYLALGAAGVAVFTGEAAGLAHMAGPTGGYLVGFAVAAWAVGALAERGWSERIGGMIGALMVGNAIIYAFGLPWMAHLFLAERGAEWVLQWGLVNFLAGDAIKLLLAALLLPGIWKLTGAARR